MDTRSQVCALAWSRNVNELVACYGARERMRPPGAAVAVVLTSSKEALLHAPFVDFHVPALDCLLA